MGNALIVDRGGTDATATINGSGRETDPYAIRDGQEETENETGETENRGELDNAPFPRPSQAPSNS